MPGSHAARHLARRLLSGAAIMTRRPALALCALSTLSLSAFACDPADTTDAEAVVASYREAWSTSDSPSLLDANFNYTFAQLPTSGKASKTPWAGSYWPTYQDSINARWAGANTQSAAKKYELAFKKTGVEDAVSEYSGIDSLTGKACTKDSECAADKGSVCAKRTGAAAGTCSETWFGICHAWSPAAILEDEPRKAVTFNGVEFKVNDLKALMSLAYTADLDVKFMSLRCDDAAGTTDVTGKPACKDTNPGSFHVAVTNLLGTQGRAFVEDRTYDYEVWNQPVRAFKVTKNAALTGQQANQLLGGGPVLATTDRSGTVAASAWTQVQNLAVAPGQTLRVAMTGTGDADLYVRWNSQPTASSYTCRPYLEGSDELCELVVPADAKTAYIAVNGYAPTSKYAIKVTQLGPAASKYAYNDKAVTLRQIQMELQWIGESAPTIDGNLSATIDQYTQKDIYDYVLELDAAGKIVGGEWIGASRQNHPDFLWLPVKKHDGLVAGVISYADIKQLFGLANGGVAPAPATVLAHDAATLAADAWKHYGPFSVDAAGLTAALAITKGDADLYVRKDAKPTTSSYDCRPYNDGLASEKCELGAGNWYVSVHGYAASTDYTLDVTRK